MANMKFKAYIPPAQQASASITMAKASKDIRWARESHTSEKNDATREKDNMKSALFRCVCCGIYVCHMC